MFRLDFTECADREAAARVLLKVFDVGPGSIAGFFERLHRTVAIFAAHDFLAFGERFVEGAWEPATSCFHLALRHDRGFLLKSHRVV